MTTINDGRDEAYRTLACEVCLYAFNDLIKNTIDIISLERPETTPYTHKRYITLTRRVRYAIEHEARSQAFKGRLNMRYEDRLNALKFQAKSSLATCLQFFEKQHPMTMALKADPDEVIRNANKIIKHWLKTGELDLITSVRAVEIRNRSGWEDEL